MTKLDLQRFARFIRLLSEMYANTDYVKADLFKQRMAAHFGEPAARLLSYRWYRCVYALVDRHVKGAGVVLLRNISGRTGLITDMRYSDSLTEDLLSFFVDRKRSSV